MLGSAGHQPGVRALGKIETVDGAYVIDGVEWCTVDELVRVLRVSRNTALGLIYDGRLPAKKLRRGAWHARKADVARFLATPDNVRPATQR